MHPRDEIKLADRAAKGDKKAFEELVRANQTNVYNLALKLMKNTEDASDAAQESFLKAYLKLSTFRGDSKFSVWLYRLTYNTCLDMIRKRHQDNVISLNPETEDGKETEIEIRDDSPGPEELYEQRETQSIIRREMARLPEEQYRILVMREISGMSYSEIADTLGITEGTVKSRIFRARSKLSELLQKNGTFSDMFRQKERREVTGDDHV